MKRLAILALALLSPFALVCRAQQMTDAEILAAIKEYPYRAAGGTSPYIFTGADYTPAPEGYAPVYISHIGRHGSRYQGSGAEAYDYVCHMMDSLHKAKALTPEGDSLRTELRLMSNAHHRMDGMLTVRGAGEQTAIAKRMSARCPEVFRQSGSRTVSCTATTSHRTIQSMAGFVAGLSAANPELDFRIACGFNRTKFNLPEDNVSSKSLEPYLKEAEKAMMPSADELKGLQTRLFKDYKAPRHLLYRLFSASSSAGCLDLDVNPLRFFTPEEQFACFKKKNVGSCVLYGTYATTREKRGKTAKEWVRLIVDEADDALEGNGHCADLRFAHDGNVGPLMALLRLGGYAEDALPEAPHRYWQSFNQVCMGSNLQLEFYRNGSSEVLVKAVFNEREVQCPELKAVNGVYYKWSDFRRYMLGRCGSIGEVPGYYGSHLNAKLAEIRKLQKDELDGFYFITDMHYPANYGSSPALIEYLENNSARRPIVFGGDVLTYVNEMTEGMPQQISALEQMHGVAPVLWARGNHDIVNYTGKKEWITAKRKAISAENSAELLARFRPLSAVSNASDPYTTYFYYDNPAAKLRYIVFDTSDKLQDDNMQDGISKTQRRWIIEQAVMGAPEGYRLMFFAHRPFLGESGKQQEDVTAFLSALSLHSTYEKGDVSYDFGTRPDLELVGVMCGHKHTDYSKQFPGGQYQINVAADCFYSRAGKMNTVEEQCFDYVSIAKDGHTIRTVRIGAGEDREFKR